MSGSLLRIVRPPAEPAPRAASPTAATTSHWQEYAIEAALLGTFMLSACLFTVVTVRGPAGPGVAFAAEVVISLRVPDGPGNLPGAGGIIAAIIAAPRGQCHRY